QAPPEEFGIVQQLVVNARAAGPRLGRDVQTAIKGAKSGDWTADDAGVVTSGGLVLEAGEYTLETVVDSGGADQGTKAVAVLPGGGFVVLSTETTPELEAEGVARDMIRAIQQARKDAGFQVSDRIETTVSGPQELIDALHANAVLVRTETLSVRLDYVPGEVETNISVERTVAS
ncbi:MAG TPA: DUF5915 domain-containing protein, partial [Micrococcaceae bacterium]